MTTKVVKWLDRKQHDNKEAGTQQGCKNTTSSNSKEAARLPTKQHNSKEAATHAARKQQN